MQTYYLFSRNREISSYLLKSLDDFNITVISDSSLLFEVDMKRAFLLLHVDSYESDRVELVTYLVKESENLKILALSNKVDFLEGMALLQAGAQGYGNTYMHGVLLHQAIEVIISGNVWIYPELAHYLIKNLKKNESKNNHLLDGLSKHEKECALLLAQGNSNKEMANLLDVQEITIKKHLSSVYKKLGFKNRMELALFVNLDSNS